MDNLKFACSWKGSLQGARLNVKIGGLQIEGCSFDGSRLSENQRDSPSISGIPPCSVAWIKVIFLALKAPITNATDEKICNIFPNFHKV